jgi:hypothetical protein
MFAGGFDALLLILFVALLALSLFVDYERHALF